MISIEQSGKVTHGGERRGQIDISAIECRIAWHLDRNDSTSIVAIAINGMPVSWDKCLFYVSPIACLGTDCCGLKRNARGC